VGRAGRVRPRRRAGPRSPHRGRARGRRLSRTDLGDLIARINAGLNFTSFALLVAGLLLIRARRLHLHRRAMTGAIWSSSIFLVFYVTRVLLTGTHRFAGTGAAKVTYFSILFSHMTLAVALVPLVLRLLYLLRHHRYREHARWARWTYPIWLYVSVTGIVVYLMLYQVYGYLPANVAVR
jgi:putative membrane protein